jgi:hypothetical protein
MNNGDFFTMSGTSQAAAAVSGVAALVIYNNPNLTPDQVKCRIIASGKPAVNVDGSLAYSVLQQGSGLVDAKAAVYGTANNCANQGLNIAADLNGTQHYMGRVTQVADGTFKVATPNGALWDSGALWDAGYMWDAAYLWDAGFLWSDAFLWPEGFLWTNATPYASDIPWVGGYPSIIGTAVSSTSAMSVNAWVAPE